MAAWSKLPPEMVVAPCKCIAHSWTDSCLVATLDLFFASCFGTLRFFTLLYLARYLSTVIKKKKNTTTLKDYLKTIIRSAACITAISTGTITLSCLLRNLLGKYYYYSLCYIPATISSLAILWETAKGKEIAVNSFANCGLEYWFWELKRRNIVEWSSNQQTALFMVISSILAYLLSSTNFKQQYYWFYIPAKVNNSTDESKSCFHDNVCWKYNWKNFITYSTTGFVLQLAKLLVYNFKNPNVILSALTSTKTYKLAAFLGCYVSVFEAVRCYLYRKGKKHSHVHDGVAGLLAGATFRFQPTIQILNSGLITVIQIVTEMTRRQKMIPDISYSEMVFVFFCGLLFHVKFVLHDHCPSLTKYIFSIVTHYRVDNAIENVNRLFKSTNV